MLYIIGLLALSEMISRDLSVLGWSTIKLNERPVEFWEMPTDMSNVYGQF